LSSWVAQLDTSNGREARNAIRNIGLPALPHLVHEVRFDGQIKVRTAAAIAALGPSALPALVRLCHDPSADVRFVAVYAIASLAPCLAQEKLKASIPTLLEALRDADPQVRYGALLAASRIRGCHAELIPGLVAMLPEQINPSEQDVVYFVRKSSQILAAFGTPARSALPRLECLLADAEGILAIDLAMAIWRIGRDPKRVMPYLQKLSRSENPDQKDRAERLVKAILAEQLEPES
jgi:hypothetical protein